MNLKSCIEKANKEFDVSNVKANKCNYVKVLERTDIDDAVELYDIAYQNLLKSNCGKFLHPMASEQLEGIITSESEAIVGFYKGGKLTGAMYTRPFEENSPYFKTPSCDEGGTAYALGGFVVDPNYRGNGIISKLAKILYTGVKEFSSTEEGQNITGMGLEISCENFHSLTSAGLLKDENGNNMINFVGVHFLSTQNEYQDKDLTILGYSSFYNNPENVDNLPSIVLDSNQSNSLEKLEICLDAIGRQTDGLSQTQIDDCNGEKHNIVLLNSYVSASYLEILSFDSYQGAHSDIALSSLTSDGMEEE